MREVAFLKQNAQKWKSFEAMLQSKNASSPDALAALFIELTDDLSYARTHYPKTKTTAYLNTLTARVHQAIYRSKKEPRGRLARFYLIELPRLFRNSHKELLYSFIIFALAVLIGVVSALNDSTFVRLILGDSYVNMTQNNIAKGDPLGVYKGGSELEMFIAITFNNIRVSFFAFAAGLCFSVGTAMLLFYNGVMLGAFQTFFYQKKLLVTSLLTIWIHGTLEISAIVVAGAAGLAMGNSILFPETFSRSESFRRGATQGVKIIIGLLPLFITAGFLESFITRHYAELPLAVSLFIIFGSLAFIVFYFIIYPIQLETQASRASASPAAETLPRAKPKPAVSLQASEVPATASAALGINP